MMTQFISSLTGQTAQPPPLNVAQTSGAQNALQTVPLVQDWANIGNYYQPWLQQSVSNLYQNPFAGSAIGSAQTAGQWGQGVAGNVYGTGQDLTSAGLGMIPGAYQIMNQAFDPQQALYNRTAQQLQDQTRAGEAVRGVQTTPYGAGVEGTTMSNFNIDWQNNLLNRMTQGAGAAGGLLNQVGGLASTGTGMQMQAPGYYAQMGALPYSTFQGVGQDQINAIMSAMGYAGAGQGLQQTPFQDYSALYGLGNQQQQVANAIYGNQIKQQQGIFGDLGAIGKGLGSFLGTPWGGSAQPTIGSTLWGSLTG